MASLLERYGWYEWSCHTNFSFLVGASHVHEYLERAVQLGYHGLAITDFNGFYGSARAHRIWSKDRKAIQLIHGTDIHLHNDHHLPITQQRTLVCIAQNYTGYANLCQLVSQRSQKLTPHISRDIFLSHSLEGVAVIVPMRGWLHHNHQDAISFFRLLKNTYKDVYLLVTRHLNPAEDSYLFPILDLAKKLKISILLGQDPFFHDRHRKFLSDTLQAVRHNASLEKVVHHLFVNDQRHLHPLPMIEKLFQSIPGYEEALITSHHLAQKCHFSLDQIQYQYPQEFIPEGMTSMDYLERLVWKSYQERYPSGSTRVLDLLEKELQLVATLKFADYFLTVWDIVTWARNNRILCQGRGSAANSAICFILGITNVDPQHFDLLFERFISLERGDPPDIDVDFEHERREEVIQYIYRRYGRSHAGMVANVITFRRKGALRATAKVFEIPDTIVHQTSAYLRRHLSPDITAKSIVKDLHLPPSRKLYFWLTTSLSLIGFPRHLGIHSGGFVINGKGLHNVCPTEPATMVGRSVIQWSKEDIEALNIFKIDILALGILTAVRKCFKLMSDHYETSPQSLQHIPDGDPTTYTMIQKADTVGTFQIESRAQMSMLPRLRPRTFYDLVVQVAIIRPGPIQGRLVHPYLKRREGIEPISYADPRMKPILERTLGIPIFQEQVMRIAMTVGNFSGGEANELRKNMGAWQFKGDLNPILKKLALGMQQNGIPEHFIQIIIKQMQAFADYGFPESHAASFAYIAYISSYLKCHFPSAYYAALLNSQPMGFYSAHALVQSAKRNGIEVRSPCVQRSEWDCTLEPNEEHPALRIGLRYVQRLSYKAAARLINSRPEGGWKHWQDFLEKADLYRGDFIHLAFANCLEVFDKSRREALWSALAFPYPALIEESDDLQNHLPQEENWERIQEDLHSTGMSLGMHPTQVILTEHWTYAIDKTGLTTAGKLIAVPRNQMVRTFGMLLMRQSPKTAKGMTFITLEDTEGFINLVFTPQIFAHYAQIIETSPFLCTEGILQKDGESLSILVHKVFASIQSKAAVHRILETSKSPPNQEEVPRVVRHRYY